LGSGSYFASSLAGWVDPTMSTVLTETSMSKPGKPSKANGPEAIARIETAPRRDRIADSIIANSNIRKRFARWLPILIVVLATLAGLISPLASWLVVLVAAVGIICIVCPVQPLLLIMFFLALAVDNPRAFPAGGLWSPPWIFIGDALYKNLEPLPLCLLDLLAGGCAIRGLFHKRTESQVRLARERIFSRIIAIAIATLVFTMFSGILRSGDLKQAVYQVRVFLWIPCFAIAIATTADFTFLRRLKTVLVLCSISKGLTGLWVYLTVASPNVKKFPLDYVTTHGDSVN
jgi:hypothetical protein